MLQMEVKAMCQCGMYRRVQAETKTEAMRLLVKRYAWTVVDPLVTEMICAACTARETINDGLRKVRPADLQPAKDGQGRMVGLSSVRAAGDGEREV